MSTKVVAWLWLLVVLVGRPAGAQDAWLPARSWDPGNRTVLERWLADVAARPASPRKVAVFDCDNTLIFHDCGEATLRFQVDHLRFKLTPADLAGLLTVDTVTALASGEALADVRADIVAAYGRLWPRILAGEAEQARGSEDHQDFRAKLMWFYDASDATPQLGPEYAYPLVARLLAGFTAAEVAALARDAMAMALAEAPGKGEWTSATPGVIGVRKGGFYTGLRAQPEMIDLVTALGRAGVEAFVASASPEAVVEAALAELGYPFDAAHVFGIRTVGDAEGRLATRVVPGSEYPFTYRPGKVELIRKFIQAEPLLVAGDTFTDYEMLVAFAGTEVRLFVNRNKAKNELVPLYRDGLEAGDRAPAPGRPRVVLQGRDEPKGGFRPGLTTIPLGATEPRVIELPPR